MEAGRGPFRPDQPLSNFNGDDSSFGVWRLAVENNASNSRSGWRRRRCRALASEIKQDSSGVPQVVLITIAW